MLTDFAACLEAWDTDYRQFAEYGGEEMSIESQKDTPIQRLPLDMTHYGMMKVHEYPTYAGLKTFLKEHIQLMVDLANRSKPVFNMEEELLMMRQHKLDSEADRSWGESEE